MRLRAQPGDIVLRSLAWGFAAIIVALAVALGLGLCVDSRLAWLNFGPAFIVTGVWDPVTEVFGALPFIYGTLVSSLLALSIAVPLGLGSAIFLAELAPKKLADACAFSIEILAAVPSVVLGLIGIFVLLPTVRAVEPFLDRYLGFIPLFKGEPYGVGMLSAGIILALMVLPYITSMSREVLLSVPRPLKEGVLALGATRWEMVRLVSLPYARSGILGSVFLASGRALGETMAVTMVIGNAPKISASLLDPAYSMAAVIANELAEATSDLHVHSLVAIGLVLFAVTALVNGLAQLLIRRLSAAQGRA
ncbi:MAG: phosphate ABC transporter permease subunit PstC [Elusimicrobiota bacterium]